MITPLEVALGLLGVGVLTAIARIYFDARDAWWKRVQWAIDKVGSSDQDDQLIGAAALVALTSGRLWLRSGDRKLLNAVNRQIQNPVSEPVDDTGPGAGPDMGGGTVTGPDAV